VPELIGDPDSIFDPVDITDETTIDAFIYTLVTTGLSAYILGGQKASLQVLIRGESTVQVGLDMEIEGEPERTTALDMLIVNELPYRYMKVRKDLTTRYFGGFASDANFFEGFDPPNVGAVVTEGIGRFNSGHRKLVYIAPNTIPTGGAFDKYSLPLTAPVTIDTIGFRALVNFRLDSFGENSSLLFGFFADQLDPLASFAAGHVCAFALETEKGHVEWRAFYGFSGSAVNLGTAVPISRFLNRDLLVVMELIGTGAVEVVEFRLYEMDASLSVPILSARAETAANPTVDRFSITSLGKRTAELPDSAMSVAFKYVDVELATGVLYDASAGIPSLDAKWRPVQNRPPIELLGNGPNQVFVALSPDGVTSNIEAEDSITVDSSDPKIFVLTFNPDSDVIVPGTVNPPVVKGSLNAGFDGVTFTWSCTHVGEYTLRIGSTSPTDGTEILNGTYPTIGAPVTTVWNFSDLPPPDGTNDVTLYLTADNGKTTAKQLGVFILPFSPKVQVTMNINIVP
jgi:hypothetical protein